jgi:hypothetical protein
VIIIIEKQSLACLVHKKNIEILKKYVLLKNSSVRIKFFKCKFQMSSLLADFLLFLFFLSIVQGAEKKYKEKDKVNLILFKII